MDDKLLIDALDKDAIKEASELFNVEEDWLKGLIDNPNPFGGHYDFYKNIGTVASRIALYDMEGLNARVHFIVQSTSHIAIKDKMATAVNDDNDSDCLPIGVVIERRIHSGEHDYKVYDVLNPERWNYEKCRIQLKTLMLFCKKAGVWFDGYCLASEQFQQLFNGQVLPVEMLGKAIDTWHPEDLLLDNKELNPEHSELRTVLGCFENSTHEARCKDLAVHVTACKTPWRLEDI